MKIEVLENVLSGINEKTLDSVLSERHKRMEKGRMSASVSETKRKSFFSLKKAIAVAAGFAVILCSIAIIIPLSKTRKGEIYCGDISDSDSLSFIKWNEYFDAANNIHNGKIDKKAELEGSEREITIEGEKYTGVYADTTSTFVFSSKMSDRYTGYGFSFMLDEKSGRLTRFSKMHSSDTAIDESSGKAAAEHFLSGILDTKQYQYSGFKDGTGENERVFIYKRVIGGIDTSESLRVTIAGDGSTVDFSSNSLGDFDGYSLPSGFSPETAHNKADNRLKEIIESQNDLNITDYSIRRRETMLVMYEGTCYYYMDYAVDIDYGEMTDSTALDLFYAID